MRNFLRHLDIVSQLVVFTTFILFAVALFIKGFGHGLLLEAGVFLISVKLIMMAHRNGILYLGRDSGLDPKRTEKAKTQVRQWTDEGCLPIPSNSPQQTREITIDPPPGPKTGSSPFLVLPVVLPGPGRL